jgi:hypothetical protein
MNKKQLIVMWIGIGAIVLAGFQEMAHYKGGSTFILWTFLIALVTGGLIVTFKDKKPKDEKDNK